MDNTFPYKASLTREQFLFYEMRTTAKLLAQGLSTTETLNQIMQENLYQYPTEKTVKRIAHACIRRLEGLHDDSLVEAIATYPTDAAKQICLYAMMLDSRLVWEFMITVIAEKYRLRDNSFGKIDLNTYFIRLQEQDDTVATWSVSTIERIKQIITKILVENEYLDNSKSTILNPVLIQPVLENAIRNSGDINVLPAFNCFS